MMPHTTNALLRTLHRRLIPGAFLLTMSVFLLSACSYSGNLEEVSCADGQPCPSGSTCVGGFCLMEGDTGFPDAGCPADQLECDGQCVPIDENNCGSCGNICGDGEVCDGQECVVDTSCEAPEEFCEGVNQCIDITSDLDHCGACDTPCDDPEGVTVSCQDTCQYECDADPSLVYCPTAPDGDQCRDLETDDQFCGECGIQCTAAETCEEGECVELDCNPTVTDAFGGGEGTGEEPYLICNKEQLNLIGADVASLSLHFRVSQPIDLEGEPFTVIGTSDDPFTGEFDGGGNEIDNLVISSTDNDIGMFGWVDGGLIRNTHLVNVEVSGDEVVGALVGGLLGTLEDSEASGSVTGNSRVGGLVGATGGDDSTISNSHADVSVSGGEFTGGLVGRNNGTIRDSTASGSVGATGPHAGGLAGRNRSSTGGACQIIDSQATGDVTAGADTIGGLVGSLDQGCSISGSTASGHVQGANSTGGLVGQSQGSISNSSATGTLVEGGNDVGGLVGHLESTGSITDSHATCDVSASGNVGGLVGVSYGAISQTYAEGTVTGQTAAIGGLVGSNNASITDSYAIGDIAAAGRTAVGGLVGEDVGGITRSHSTGTVNAANGSDIGGLVGISTATISQSFSQGDVNADGASDVGGLVGELNNGEVRDSYALGDVTGGEQVGGLCGRLASGDVIDSYSFGDPSGSSHLGALVGRSTGSTNIDTSYWNSDNTAVEASVGGTGLTNSEFTDESNFDGWDFSEVWVLEEEGLDRPQLRWQ